jgi:hypothetical protein
MERPALEERPPPYEECEPIDLDADDLFDVLGDVDLVDGDGRLLDVLLAVEALFVVDALLDLGVLFVVDALLDVEALLAVEALFEGLDPL